MGAHNRAQAAGRVIPAAWEHLPAWLARFAGQDDVHFAVEGLRWVPGMPWRNCWPRATPQLAVPTDTAALRMLACRAAGGRDWQVNRMQGG